MNRYDISGVPEAVRPHLIYSMNFCDPSIQSFQQDGDALIVICSGEPVHEKVERLIARFSQSAELFEARVIRAVGPPRVPSVDPYEELVARRLVVEVGPGQRVMRGLMAQLVEAVDKEVRETIAKPIHAAFEIYPNSIRCDVLARTNHLSSFPEHLHFISHLRSDIDVIDSFGAEVRTQSNRWTEGVAVSLQHAVDPPDLILNPSVCYHCYASRAGEEIENLEIVTARSRCHRYEGGAMQGLRRLSDFDMREVVFLGHPERVRDVRGRVADLLLEMAMRWEISARLVNANDPFFTRDFEMKAAFQRRQDLKHELVIDLPGGGEMAISSSNFHATTFGQAFGISRRSRPVTTGCVGWGLERWAYAILIQHGTHPEAWPPALRASFDSL